MIRAFHLRDLTLVHRLSEHGVSLHTESALTRNLQPVRGALFSLVGGDFPTYVWKASQEDTAGFIQLYLEEDAQHAHILYVSTEDSAETGNHDQQSNGRNQTSLNETAWLSLLDQAVAEVGQRGIHSLVAEVDETGPELPVLRRAGFVVYTRQDVWMLNTTVESPPANLLHPRGTADDWEIQLLYANIVPRLVQLVEPVPRINDGIGWVLREGDEMAAFVHVYDGPVATWIRLFVHPNAESRAEEIITAVLQKHAPRPSHPVYCCVRRYQSWLQNPLARAGFQLWGSQAVMVKHTVYHSQEPKLELSAALEAQGITPTAPYIQHYQTRSEKQNGKPTTKGTAV
ncbi:MAG TPA: hypothetical protein EYP41_02080 [Anaerolineae bacterium]|nr:hypothetical protein [Anaerolineae bacterium]